jgi:hypothetical protein
MEFVGYSAGEMVGVAQIIHAYNGNYVISDVCLKSRLD